MDAEQPPRVTPAGRTGDDDIPGARMAALTAYLETNQTRYAEAALRRAALEAGYRPDEIDLAIRRLATSGPRTDPARPPFSAATSVLTFLGFLFVVWLGLSAVDSIGRVVFPSLPALPIGWVAVGIVGTTLWWWARERHPSLARGVATGVILVVVLPAVLFLVVLGMCVVTGGTPAL